MEKYSSYIITNTGKKKEISVFLDDQTSKALDEANDIRITNAYITEEYKDNLTSRKETRRHVSFEHLTEQGYEFAEDIDYAEEAYKEFRIKLMKKALETLTEIQYKILIAKCIDNISFREIGRRMGISKTTVSEHFYAAEEKIKKFFKNNPAKM
ncbi:MAG: sigma-70 family RNA polymerase sigma factor [Clostridia bacterium]|nr:sigma-70 family RNA polymerase sigma factor [Clostridia bacterium]